ncbi:MAG: 4-hydroxythreonine-4-phosphate dehydrogenase PdxA [Hydrogenophilaceae bacterium]|jgi:4-hydroxythreonine-4-phosphate dehydrogenase|nr:4-hydroxythreonine-4-phosphate dehydrogenase PdxA [Hydrogenophilaceae bacterium]
MSAMKPIAVSMGDPAGVGLEIAARAFAERDEETPRFFLIGDPFEATVAASRAGLVVRAKAISKPADALETPPDQLPVLPKPLTVPAKPGEPDPRHAPQITAAIADGVDACLKGEAAALVTLPIAKATLLKAGFEHPGHTEYLAALTASAPYAGARGPVMMLTVEGLRVALVTIHTPLAEVPAAVTQERIMEVARVVADALRRDFGVERPRLALAGLNPHAGESGEIGREEIEIINPAAAALRAQGLDASDAMPADSMFHEAARATYDAAICMYHDQALIPIKTLDFWRGVNVTLGLPIVRTSPDHGAAFDIAGRGLARADSFVAALKLAQRMAETRAGPR